MMRTLLRTTLPPTIYASASKIYRKIFPAKPAATNPATAKPKAALGAAKPKPAKLKPANPAAAKPKAKAKAIKSAAAKPKPAKAKFIEPEATDEQLVVENEELFRKINLDINRIKEILEANQLTYSDCKISWHYHVFAGLSDYFLRRNNSVKRILEIGTHNGSFARFLSNVYPDAEIYTIDLPEDNEQFTSTYGRQIEEKKKKFLSVRSENLSAPNINFIEMNSTNLPNRFNGIEFDVIWVDGDHHNPQVTIDIMNALSLLSHDGVMCVDDIIMSDKLERSRYVSANYVSNESYQTLKTLGDNGVLQNYFVNKRTYKNQETMKYVSISTKNHRN